MDGEEERKEGEQWDLFIYLYLKFSEVYGLGLDESRPGGPPWNTRHPRHPPSTLNTRAPTLEHRHVPHVPVQHPCTSRET